MGEINLSLLDFGHYYPPEVHTHNVINHLLTNITEIEKAGYKRLWLSEHYGNDIAWGSPDILLPLLAGYTTHIKIGCAGVLLRYSSALRLVHTYKMLSAIYPGRIDLGLAKGGVTDDYAQALIHTDISPNMAFWEQQVRDLYNFLHHSFPEGHPYKKIAVPPYGTPLPGLWFLGASSNSIPIALEHKGNFCLSLFHTNRPAATLRDIIKRYREDFYKRYNELPECNLAIQCNCSNNRQTLKKFTEEMIGKGWIISDHALCGSPEYCRDKIMELAALFDVNEVVVLNAYYTLQEKQESILLLAENVMAL